MYICNMDRASLPEPMRRDIGAFLDYLRAELLRSPCTVKAYGDDLRQFAAWLAAGGDPDLRLATQGQVRGWLGETAEAGSGPRSLRRKLQSLRSYYKWCLRRGTVTVNPAADVALAKAGKRLPAFVRENDMERLLATPDENPGYDSARTRIVLTLLYTLGLRQAELLSLTDADVDFGKGEVKVLGKRNKERIVPLPPDTAAELRQWQAVRDERWPDIPAPRPVLAGRSGPLSRETLYNIVRRGLAGVPAARRSPHTLRHTFATAMVNNGADLDSVREMLGHASLSTTQIYTHLGIRELLAGYRSAHPRAGTPPARKDPLPDEAAQ